MTIGSARTIVSGIAANDAGAYSDCSPVLIVGARSNGAVLPDPASRPVGAINAVPILFARSSHPGRLCGIVGLA
jgi:hypothetical protein